MKLNFFIKSYFLSIFAHVGILIATLITFPEKSKSSECPDDLNMNIQTEDCYQTPDVMEIKFYELGFCTSDPLSGTDFSRNNCSKAWEYPTGQTVDLADFEYQNLTDGNTYRIPNNRYDYAYVIFSNIWGMKGRVYFNGDKYYSTSSGAVVTMEFMFDKFNLEISQLEGGAGCWDYSSDTDYGTVKAVLANSSLVTATNNTECLNANRMIGSINLNNPLNMTSSVKGYRLSWIIKKMGLKLVRTFF